jgi:hypothetical protein
VAGHRHGDGVTRWIESAGMRREFLLLGAFVIGALSLGARLPDPEAALEARTARLQAHIENVESVRAIKRLQYAYGHYAELGLRDFQQPHLPHRAYDRRRI